jgi:hypothetical protein
MVQGAIVGRRKVLGVGPSFARSLMLLSLEDLLPSRWHKSSRKGLND